MGELKGGGGSQSRSFELQESFEYFVRNFIDFDFYFKEYLSELALLELFFH